MKNRRLKLSVNPKLIDKIKPIDQRYFSQGFYPCEFTIEDLADVIHEDGFAFSYQFANDTRKTENFISTDFLAIDIDQGWVMSEMLENPIVTKYCSLVYTTPSHSPDCHRFRLVFVLPRTIKDAEELKAATRVLARRLGGDMSATDAARMFYGSKGSLPKLLGKKINAKFLNELIEDGKVDPVSDSVANQGDSVTSRSDLKLDPYTEIITSKHQKIKLKDFTQKTTVFCPFHLDKSASAFVSLNKKNDTFIHCSTCQLTRWMKSKATPTFNFNDFEETIRSHKLNPLKSNVPKPTDKSVTRLDDFIIFDPDVHLKNIQFTYDKFFKLSEIKPGLTFIKSPKGSGKTTALADMLGDVIHNFKVGTLESYLEAYEENSDGESPSPFYSETKVLLIGHRQALIRDLCKRLELNCYLDDESKGYGVSKIRDRYGVCLDSLRKLKGYIYDIVVIDEVEQVLSHFLSDTIGSNSIDIFEIFKNLIRRAKSVVVLDADLGWVSFNTITSIASKDQIKTPVEIYINDWKPPSKSLNLFPSNNQLIDHLKESILSGKRVFVTSNSKGKINNLEKSIEDLSKETGKSISMIAISSENSRTKDTQKFINNIKTEILKYQVILTSPSLGTGVDITFANGKAEVDCVYGFFENRINSHTEIDQQLARVRNPKEVNVWISPIRFNFETEFEIVKLDLINNNMMHKIYSEYESNSGSDSTKKTPIFLTMAALITTQQRASKNHLKINFIDYKKNNNWKINPIQANATSTKKGKQFYDKGKLIRTQTDIDDLIKAHPMEFHQYVEFEKAIKSNTMVYSRSDYLSYTRTGIELFYREKISISLIVLYTSKHREKVRRFEEIREVESIKTTDDIKSIGYANGNDEEKLISRLQDKIFRRGISRELLLYTLFSLTPIFKRGYFDPHFIFKSSDLTEFAKLSKKLKSYVETQLGINTSDDILNKPVQHLGKLLKLVGLQHKRVSASTINGVKVYTYSLINKVLEDLTLLVIKRRETNEWVFVNKLHNFKIIGIDQDDSEAMMEYMMEYMISLEDYW